MVVERVFKASRVGDWNQKSWSVDIDEVMVYFEEHDKP